MEKSIKDKAIIRLDIGCGANKQAPDWVGIDYRALPGVDIVQDLEVFPWKGLEDNSVQVAVCSHVVEHINPSKGTFINFMSEVWRILQPGGEFAIVTPYAGSHGYFQDPTHINPCNETTWKYFDPLDVTTGGQLYRIYEPPPWEIKINTFRKEGNLEVVLVKRKDDPSYHQDKKDPLEMNPGTTVKIIGGEYEDLIGITGIVVGDGFSSYPSIHVSSLYRGDIVTYTIGIKRKYLKVINEK